MPKISIVIPLYNKGPYIKTSIDSVLNQTYDDYELVIVDDGSTDNSVEVIKNSYTSEKIRIIQKENGGPSSARNRGVQEARGEWIVFLDADDLLLPKALSYFSSLIKKNQDVNYIVCNYYIAYNREAKLFTTHKHKGIVKNPFFLEAIRELTDRPGSSIIKRELLLQHPFNIILRRFEDAESQYEIMRRNMVYQSPIPVMISNRDAGSASLYRKNIEEDFVGYLEFEGKSFWEQMALFHLALDCKRGYPEDAERLYRKIYRRIDLNIAFLLMRIYWRIDRYICKIFKRNRSITIDELMRSNDNERK